MPASFHSGLAGNLARRRHDQEMESPHSMQHNLTRITSFPYSPMPPDDRCLPVSPSFIDQRLRRQYNHTSAPFNSPDALSKVALRPKPPTAVFAHQETLSKMSLDCTSCVVLSATGMLANLTGRAYP